MTTNTEANLKSMVSKFLYARERARTSPLLKSNQRKRVRRHWERVWKEYDSEERRMDNWAKQHDSVSMKRKRWIIK